MLRTLRWLSLTLWVMVALGGCEPPTLDEMNERYGTSAPPPTVADFDPVGVDACSGESAVRLPQPINLGFIGSEDGTLALENSDSSDMSDVGNALGTLDGWSTTEPIRFSFSGPIDATTVRGGGVYGDTSGTVRVFKVELSQDYPFPTSVRVDPKALPVELIYGVDYELEVNRFVEVYADPDDECQEKMREKDRVSIIPLRPLDPASTYLVGVTDGILGEDGEPVESDAVYRIGQSSEALVDEYGHSRLNFIPGLREDEVAAGLEGLRAMINSFELALSVGHGVSGLVLSWVFTTQDARAGLEGAAEQVEEGAFAWGPALDAGGLVLSTCALNGVDGGGEVLCNDPSLPFTGIGDIYLGLVEVTDFLGKAPGEGFWRSSDGGALTRFVVERDRGRALKEEGTESAPFIAVLPGPASGRAKPIGGWPVVIFGHTLGQNRTNVLAIAEALAARGLAAVAMDLPLHGVEAFVGGDPAAGPNPFFPFSLGAPATLDTAGGPVPFGFYRNLPWFSGMSDELKERHAFDYRGNTSFTDSDACDGGEEDGSCDGTFDGEPFSGVCRSRGGDLTCVRCDSGGPDGIEDPSGAHYFNPAVMLRSRDNMRQGVTNLLQLRRTLSVMRVPLAWEQVGALQENQGEVGTPVFDDSRVTFLGHGLGASLGVLLMKIDPTVKAGALVSPLVGIARGVDASPVLGELLGTGLSCLGVTPGSGSYEDFLGALQTVMDGADPINYSVGLTQPILMQEIVGHPEVGGAGTLFFEGDAISPVVVDGLPLVGSSVLADLLGLTTSSSDVVDPQGVRVRVRVSTAGHTTFLNPMIHCDAAGERLAGLLGEQTVVALEECYQSAAAAQYEMLNEVGSFLSMEGTAVEISAVREWGDGLVDVLAPLSY